MKKLMIAAAVALAAIVSQAATFDWSIADLQNANGEALDGGYVYTFSSKEGTIKTTDALIEALTAAKTGDDIQAIANQSFSALNGAVSEGTFAKTDITPSDSGLTPGKLGTKLFALVTDTATITDSTKWYVTDYSASAKVPTDDGITPASYEIIDEGSHSSENWKGSAAPEPTTGLLMLVGLAGLALRRRA